MDAGRRIGVPSFLGEPLRVAVETAATAGLALQIVGSGIAREQVPAPGSMVPSRHRDRGPLHPLEPDFAITVACKYGERVVFP